MKFPIGAMSVGDVLDRALKLLLARLPLFYAINLVVMGPLILFQIATPFLADGDPVVLGVSSLGVILLALVLAPIGTAATLHVVLEEFRGKSASLGGALGFALTRFVPLLGASILAGIIVTVGFLLCIAPGVYFAVSYIFVGQVVVAEGVGGGAALSRSKELISGHRGRVFGVIVLIYLAIFAVSAALGAGLQAVLPAQELVQTDGGIQVQGNPVNTVVDTLVSQLVQILFTTYLAVCTTLMYLDLRIRKEGLDLEMAAEEAAGRADDGGEPTPTEPRG